MDSCRGPPLQSVKTLSGRAFVPTTYILFMSHRVHRETTSNSSFIYRCCALLSVLLLVIHIYFISGRVRGHDKFNKIKLVMMTGDNSPRFYLLTNLLLSEMAWPTELRTTQTTGCREFKSCESAFLLLWWSVGRTSLDSELTGCCGGQSERFRCAQKVYDYLSIERRSRSSRGSSRTQRVLINNNLNVN